MKWFQTLRNTIGAKILGPEFRRMRREIAKVQDVDYSLAYQAYKKYCLSIIKEPRARLEFPLYKKPLVSVIIPVYNQYKYTMRCLQSLLDTTTDIPYEIIIGDDNSTDETQNICEKVRNIRVVRNLTKPGFLTNVNHASQYASGAFLYLLNNDTQLFPETISALAHALNMDPQLAIVGSKCIYPDGHLQSAGAFWTKGGKTSNWGHRDNPLKDDYNYFRYVDYCPGASLMIRRDFWEAEKGFDEQFSPGYYEETDLCARAKLGGFKVAYQPNSEIIHFTSVSFGEKVNDIMSINRKLFYKKWHIFLQL